MQTTPSRVVDRFYVATAAAVFLVFLAGASLLAVTLPYHGWDAFGFGDWSRRIAAGGSIDPLRAGPLAAGRPLFYTLQGGLWALTGGVSFTAGRLLSLGFAIALIVCVAGAARALTAERRLGAGAAAAAVLIIAIPSFTQEAIAGDSDVPAAAMVALCAWLVFRRRPSREAALALAAAALAAVLTKPTVIVPLLGLGLWLFFDNPRPLRKRLLSVAPLGAGLVAGIAYLTVMAARFHTWLLPFLRTGTTEGLWAQRAAAARLDAVVGLSFMGDALRLPLAFALIYGCLRATGIAHRRAAVIAFVAGVVWAVAGPASIGEPGPFSSAELGFVFIGFAVLLVLVALARPDEEPNRTAIAASVTLGLPSFAIWAYSTAYFDRLAATAWPGLTLLIAQAILPGVRVLGRTGSTLVFVPLTVLAAAAWIGLGTLDGLHGYQWVEYRSLGAHGVWDHERTMNIVLPQVQSALALAEPHLGSAGRLSVSDPRFSFFLPGRVDTEVALHCAQVKKDAVFILLTSDESEQLAQSLGGLATPEQWARCTSPKLEEVAGSPDGFAIFARTAS